MTPRGIPTRLGIPARLPALLCVGLLLAGGCGTTESREGYGVSATQFQDMIVPTGFQLRDKGHESYSREEVGWRQGHFVYSGADPMEAALAYVRQHMPRHSWQIVKDEALEDSVHLRFERGVYSADYTFSRREGATQMVVVYNTDYSRR
jgi:hypothetical protein